MKKFWIIGTYLVPTSFLLFAALFSIYFKRENYEALLLSLLCSTLIATFYAVIIACYSRLIEYKQAQWLDHRINFEKHLFLQEMVNCRCERRKKMRAKHPFWKCVACGTNHQTPYGKSMKIRRIYIDVKGV